MALWSLSGPMSFDLHLGRFPGEMCHCEQSCLGLVRGAQSRQWLLWREHPKGRGVASLEDKVGAAGLGAEGRVDTGGGCRPESVLLVPARPLVVTWGEAWPTSLCFAFCSLGKSRNSCSLDPCQPEPPLSSAGDSSGRLRSRGSPQREAPRDCRGRGSIGKARCAFQPGADKGGAWVVPLVGFSGEVPGEEGGGSWGGGREDLTPCQEGLRTGPKGGGPRGIGQDRARRYGEAWWGR